MKLKALSLACCVLILIVVSKAQVAKTEDFFLESKLMGRQMPYRVIFPANYQASEKRYPVIYLLHGLSGNYKNWTEKTGLTKYATEYDFLIVTVEGENGWYSDSKVKPNSFYESYIIEELIPEVDKKFRTIANRNHRIIAGLSMGGYGAIKFGLKYPEKFVLVGSFSGALAATSIKEGMALEWITKTIGDAFGPEESESRKANDIYQIVRNLSDEQIKKLPFIYFDCGTEDFLFKDNQDFMKLVVEKRIKHEYRQKPGAHTWDYWDSQIQEFLKLAKKFTEKPL
jgi:putative tributyrin esterase